MALSHVGVHRSRVVMIGDATYDLEARTSRESDSNGRATRVDSAHGAGRLPGTIAAAVLAMPKHPSPPASLSEADLHRLRASLSRKRDELLAARRSSEAERRGIADREAEEGDMAEQVIEQEAALRVGGFDAELLGEVEHALKKLDDGSYGISEDSGAPIPVKRLDALPWARRTAEEEDRRQQARRPGR